MESEIDLVFEILYTIYYPFDILFSMIFFYCTSFLRILTISIIFVLSLSRIFTIMNTKFYKFMKVLLFIWYFGYTMYTLGMLENLRTVNILDWSTFAFSIIAPISMVILGRQASGWKVKGRRIFVYLVMIIIYLVVSLIWWLYFPESAIFTLLFAVTIIIAFIVSIIDYLFGE